MKCQLILTLIIEMTYLTINFFISPVTHRSAESKGLQFNLLWRLWSFPLSQALYQKNNIFLCSTTEFKIYFLLITIKSFLFLQVT